MMTVNVHIAYILFCHLLDFSGAGYTQSQVKMVRLSSKAIIFAVRVFTEQWSDFQYVLKKKTVFSRYDLIFDVLGGI